MHFANHILCEQILFKAIVHIGIRYYDSNHWLADGIIASSIVIAERQLILCVNSVII
jgi:hypothetical protein